LARSLETKLNAAVGVVSARASALTGTVLVNYAPPATLQSLVSVVDAVVEGQVPEASGPHPQRPVRGRGDS
jgi:hypothetical protein